MIEIIRNGCEQPVNEAVFYSEKTLHLFGIIDAVIRSVIARGNIVFTTHKFIPTFFGQNLLQ
jgi:hypothetical protein